MKPILKIMALSAVLLGLVSCNKLEPEFCVSFAWYSFERTYLEHFENDDVFLVKGVAQDVYRHGRGIEIIEDLKGNFTWKPSIFVWGSTGVACATNSTAHLLDARIDFITQYHKNDTLIMFVRNAERRFNRDIERSSDYTVLRNYSSAVKLSNDTVRGFITDTVWEMPWEDFQVLLNLK